MNGSGRLRRFTATFTGLSASTVPPSVAANVPNRRCSRHHSSATEPAPASAPGSNRPQLFRPSRRTLAASIHSEAGGLSMLMNPPGSSETKKKLCHDEVMPRIAAV